ncbi:MAG: histidine kinase [Nitrosopumilales archaeon CG15_BIG_FIL_POST_REV_8_21_14_020_37_12]|nr:MAG: histidine kinase [Nitrosopumilales archaeon CG15_BIG_FIL_POST_REV_8_21_14_020_37_12]
MAIISAVYAIQSYVTFEVNSEQLIESTVLKNQVIASSLIQNLDLFIDKRISDFQSLEKAKEIRQILQSSNDEFSKIPDIDAYVEEKTFSYKNYSRYLPFITQAVEQRHLNELSSIIANYDQTYGFDFANEFFVTNAYGANIVPILGVSDYVQYDKEWWQATKSDGIYVGDVEYFPDYDSYSVPLGISISDENGKFLGAIRVLIALDHLLSDFTSNAVLLDEQSKQVVLLDDGGQIIYSNGIKYGENVTASYFAQLDDTEGSFEFSSNDSTHVLSYSKSTNSKTGLGWIAVIQQSKANIITSLDDVRNSLVFPSIIGAIVTIVIGILITIFVSKPLEKLTKIYNQMSSGNFDVRAEPNIIHEINTLSNSYNNFAMSLKKLIQTEKDLAESKVKVRNERLTAIGELSASMAHDMKNSLAILKTATDVLKRKFGSQDEKVDKVILNMDEGINRIAHQINDVLEYVRITPMNLTKTNLTQLIDSAINSIQIPPSITLTFPKQDISIECDKQKMEIVLINLILNAIQAIGEKPGEIIFSTKDIGDAYEIEIKNSGLPIPEEILHKIFEPLFTTKLQGTGLGLATCKNVIVQHGGSIYAQNNPTKFTIVFPKHVVVDNVEKDK